MTIANEPLRQRLQFDTFGEPLLQSMVAAAIDYMRAFTDHPNADPHWLTFSGPSGVGKTHLATKLCEAAREVDELVNHPTLISPVQFKLWPDILNEMKDGDYRTRTRLRECNFLVIDDIGSVKNSPFALDELYSLLAGRERKWTVITTNLTRHQIAGHLDVRIASRLTRHGSRYLDIEGVKDYGLRNRRPE